MHNSYYYYLSWPFISKNTSKTTVKGRWISLEAAWRIRKNINRSQRNLYLYLWQSPVTLNNFDPGFSVEPVPGSGGCQVQ